MNIDDLLAFVRALPRGSADVEAIYAALLSAAYYDPEWRWVQQHCFKFLNHDDNSVRRVAATCPWTPDPEIGTGSNTPLMT